MYLSCCDFCFVAETDLRFLIFLPHLLSAEIAGIKPHIWLSLFGCILACTGVHVHLEASG